MGDVFELAGDLAYLVRRESKSGALWLDVLDVASDPAHPRRRGTVDLGTRFTNEYGGIAQANDRAVVVIERPVGIPNRSKLIIIDARNPEMPQVERTALLPEGKRYKDVDVRGDLLFLLDSTPNKPNGLAIYRMPADGDPELIGEALSPDIMRPIDLVVHGDVVYGTFKPQPMLATFDVSNPRNPKMTDVYAQKEPWSAGLGMSLVGNRLYVTGDTGPAPIFDVSVARMPRLLGRWEYQGGSVDGVILEGTRAVAKGFNGDVFFFDVSNRSAPARVGTFRSAPLLEKGGSIDWQWTDALAVNGPRAVVAHETLPAQVLDISHPGHAVVQGTFVPRGLVHAIALTVTHAFLGYRAPAGGKAPRVLDPSTLGERGGIETIDLHDPHAPHSVGVLTLDAAVTDMARHNDHLVAAGADGSLAVVDIQHPERPTVLGRLAGSGKNAATALVRPTRLALSADGRLAYVTRTDDASGMRALTVVDLREPATPRVLGQLHMEGSGSVELPLAVDGARVAILVGEGELLIVNAGDPARPVVTIKHSLPDGMFAGGLAFNHDAVFLAAGEGGLVIYQAPPAPKGTGR
jgi:hypothetical protein